MNNDNNMQTKISAIYYLILGIPSVFFSFLILYLIMSEFNKKTIKETFYSKDKCTIIIL